MPGSDGSGNANTSAQEDNPTRKLAAVVVAALLLLAYVVLVYKAWGATGEAAESWARKIYLLGGLEALAFAAAGWFFGREVSREAIDALESKAGDARGEADTARAQEQEKTEQLGRARSEAAALAGAVTAFAATEPSEPGIPGAQRGRTAGGLEALLGRANHVLNAYGEGPGS